MSDMCEWGLVIQRFAGDCLEIPPLEMPLNNGDKGDSLPINILISYCRAIIGYYLMPAMYQLFISFTCVLFFENQKIKTTASRRNVEFKLIYTRFDPLGDCR